LKSVKYIKGAGMRTNYITVKIIEYLSDNKLHTYAEIAKVIEVCKNTVIRHIRDLSSDYNIITYHGGREKGVKLLRSNRVYLTEEEKRIIARVLRGLNDPSLEKLISKFEVQKYDD